MSGVFFANFACAQNIDILSEYAGPGANISLSGPYILDATEHWIARIDSNDYVITQEGLISEPDAYMDIILVEETYKRIPLGISVFSLGSKVQVAFAGISGTGITIVSDYIVPWAYTTIGLVIEPSALLLPNELTGVAGDFIGFSRDALQFQLAATGQSIAIYRDLKTGSQLLQNLKDTKDAKYAKEYISNNQQIISRADGYLEYQETCKKELLDRYNLISAKSSGILEHSIPLLPEFPGSSEMNIKLTSAKSKELNVMIQTSVQERIKEHGTV
ncbi:MAG: hypothetical protein J7M14_02445 [Planctomycetes bacterium]|nr:hypothetical protein [Planctomycetota bacterium]